VQTLRKLHPAKGFREPALRYGLRTREDIRANYEGRTPNSNRNQSAQVAPRGQTHRKKRVLNSND